MSATLTLTGTIGPGNSLSAAVYSGISRFTIDCEVNTISFFINNVLTTIGITAATTITATKSGSVYTLTIS